MSVLPALSAACMQLFDPSDQLNMFVFALDDPVRLLKFHGFRKLKFFEYRQFFLKLLFLSFELIHNWQPFNGKFLCFLQFVW